MFLSLDWYTLGKGWRWGGVVIATWKKSHDPSGLSINKKDILSRFAVATKKSDKQVHYSYDSYLGYGCCTIHIFDSNGYLLVPGYGFSWSLRLSWPKTLKFFWWKIFMLSSVSLYKRVKPKWVTKSCENRWVISIILVSVDVCHGYIVFAQNYLVSLIM